MSRILAIDYGLKRTGLAVTDPLQMIANPLDTIPSNELIPFLKKYLASEEVERFVLGEPKRLDGSETHSSKGVADCMKLLEKSFPQIPVNLVDERFTSKMATAAILSAGAKKSQRQDKALVDKVSAVIILQT
ncbi:MAG: Holliday junction resolvase RuvX, partial [Flavobacteriales bacterium]|nr:Holliday junction resolvase RuvX [Flavobacteriales bacterium]